MNVLAVAHRAGNSLSGLREATALGVDVIECDVHDARGRLEVRHLKTAGPLPFLWDRWELVSASAPRLGLAELLAADALGTTFMLDIKGRRTSAARAVAKFLHHGGHHQPVLVCGRHWPSVDIVSRLPFAHAVPSARNRLELNRLRQRLAGPPATSGVSVHASLLNEDVVSELRDRVEVVMTWPINDLKRLDSVLSLGVTGIISDNPTVLRELIRRRA